EDLATLLDVEIEVAPHLRHDALLQLALADARLERAGRLRREDRGRREHGHQLSSRDFSFPYQDVHRSFPLSVGVAFAGVNRPMSAGASVQQSSTVGKELPRF